MPRNPNTICDMCKIDIYRKPSELLKFNNKFCSKKCKGNYAKENIYLYEENFKKGRGFWKGKTKDNGYDWSHVKPRKAKKINLNCIKYEKQKQINNLTVPDFFIKPNICIYADGDYWHNLSKVKKRDLYINKILKENNYIVIRILGSKIKQGYGLNEILQYIK